MPELELTVNGEDRRAAVAVDAALRDVLRAEFGLTGAKPGCDTGRCGMCTVHLDGEPVKSCLVLAHQAADRDVTTIEGLDDEVPGDGLHPVQQAFIDGFASQCGYCIPGMVMTAAGIVDGADDPSREEIRAAIEGNLCRCTGYRKIVDAIADAAGE